MPFFCFLLGKALRQSSRHTGNLEKVDWQRILSTVIKLGVTVLLTFAICWAPFFLTGSLEGGIQVLRRLFPFGRGLYEDKVANFWCSVSVLLKVRQLFSRAFLVNLSVVVTLITLLPSSIGLLRKPTPYNFLLALVRNIVVIGMISFSLFSLSLSLSPSHFRSTLPSPFFSSPSKSTKSPSS